MLRRRIYALHHQWHHPYLALAGAAWGLSLGARTDNREDAGAFRLGVFVWADPASPNRVHSAETARLREMSMVKEASREDQLANISDTRHM